MDEACGRVPGVDGWVGWSEGVERWVGMFLSGHHGGGVTLFWGRGEARGRVLLSRRRSRRAPTDTASPDDLEGWRCWWDGVGWGAVWSLVAPDAAPGRDLGG